MPRQVIIGADDFGRSREVNEAVILAHREGVLTSASRLMVTGDACGTVRLDARGGNPDELAALLDPAVRDALRSGGRELAAYPPLRTG